jgi:hypothetical protein
MGLCFARDAHRPSSGVGTVGRCGGSCRARVPDGSHPHPFRATGGPAYRRAKRESVASGSDRPANPARTHHPTDNRDASSHPNDRRRNFGARGLPVTTDSPSRRKPNRRAHRTGSIHDRDALAGAGPIGHLPTGGAPPSIEPPSDARRKRRWRLGCWGFRRTVSLERCGSLADRGRRRGAHGAAAGSMRRTEPRPPSPLMQAKVDRRWARHSYQGYLHMALWPDREHTASPEPGTPVARPLCYPARRAAT